MRTTILTCLFLFSTITLAQDAPGQNRARGEGFRDMDRVMGTVVSVGSDNIVLKPENGEQVTVRIVADTRIRKNRQEVSLADFKVGEHMMAFGKAGADKTFTAAAILGGEMRGFGPGGAPPSIEEMQKMGLGTKFIAGEVKAIHETKLTILRPDGQTQTIEVDENTSFHTGHGGESGTLADIQVGDHVMGRGEMKDGVFVPQNLRAGGPEGMRGGTGGRQHPDGAPPGPPTTQNQPK
jgi:hypothetical protein